MGCYLLFLSCSYLVEFLYSFLCAHFKKSGKHKNKTYRRIPMKVCRMTLTIVIYGKNEEEASKKLVKTVEEAIHGDAWDMHVCVENEVDTEEEGLDEDILED